MPLGDSLICGERDHLTNKNRFGDPLILEQNRKTILMNFRFGLYGIDTNFFFFFLVLLFLSKLVFFFLFFEKEYFS